MAGASPSASFVGKCLPCAIARPRNNAGPREGISTSTVPALVSRSARSHS